MADIRVSSTEKVFYRIDDGVAALLLEALPTVFERANTELRLPVAQAASTHVPNYKTPEWSVGLSATGLPTITLKTGRTELSYPGSLEGAAFHFKRAGFEIPDHVLVEYARLLNQPVPPVTLSDQDLAKHADSTSKYPLGMFGKPAE